MSVIELATMRAKEGRGDDLDAAFPAALAVVSDHADGCRAASVLRCVERPDEFVLRIEWDSVAAHEEFRASPEFPAFRAELAATLEEVVGYAHYVER